MFSYSSKWSRNPQDRRIKNNIMFEWTKPVHWLSNIAEGVCKRETMTVFEPEHDQQVPRSNEGQHRVNFSERKKP